jgi:hypothetical protein
MSVHAASRADGEIYFHHSCSVLFMCGVVSMQEQAAAR